VHQVGHYPELHQDAQSTKHKIIQNKFRRTKIMPVVFCRREILSVILSGEGVRELGDKQDIPLETGTVGAAPSRTCMHVRFLFCLCCLD
jgi:hypothetical protein